MTSSMKDKFGSELVPGDIVAYGVRRGNSGALRIGKIVRVENHDPASGLNSLVFVIGVLESFSGEPTGPSKARGRLTMSDRVVKLSQVGSGYLDVLNNVEIDKE